jgi:hypothetical protein
MGSVLTSNAEEVEQEMNFLAAVPYFPHHGTAGAADWLLIVGLVAVMAIALTAVFVYAGRSAKTPPRDSETADADRKAA